MDKNKKSQNIINKYELLKFINKKTGSFIDEVDTTFKLINNFEEIETLLNQNSDKFKFIYFSTNIKNILYDSEKEIILNSDKIENSLDKIFYLSLLVTENKEIINYKYSFYYIKQLDKSNENNNLQLRKMIFSKIILDLIDYFKGFEEYDKDIESSIDDIKDKNINIIKNNNNILKVFNLEFEDFINKSIDEIYSHIIKTLLQEYKNYKYIHDIIINELNLDKIDITNFIFKVISKILSNDKGIIEKRMIININDLFNEDKIEFYYILLKYILKNICYISQIPFLKDTREFILKNIKSIKTDNTNKKKLEYLIHILTGSKYYSNRIEIIQNDDNNGVSTLSIINDNLEESKEISEVGQKLEDNSLEKNLQIKENENQTTKPETSKKLEGQDKNLSKGSNSNNNLMNLNKDIKIVNKYEMIQYINEISNILERIAITYEIIKNKKRFIICTGGEKSKLIDYDILIKQKDNANFFDLDNVQFIKYTSFVKFVNYLQAIDEMISKEYGAKDFVGIKMLFEHEKLVEKQNKNGIFNLTCQYGTFSNLNTEGQLKYKDENILLNGFNQGFQALLYELNEI